MKRTLLLVVEDVFEVAGMGLVLVPDFAGDTDLNKSDLQAEGEIERPDGTLMRCQLDVLITHINTAEVQNRWRYVVRLSGCKKVDVPLGSKVYCSTEILASDVGQ